MLCIEQKHFGLCGRFLCHDINLRLYFDCYLSFATLVFSGSSSNLIPFRPHAHPYSIFPSILKSITMKTWGDICLCITSFVLFFCKMSVPIRSLNIILKHPNPFSEPFIFHTILGRSFTYYKSTQLIVPLHRFLRMELLINVF